MFEALLPILASRGCAASPSEQDVAAHALSGLCQNDGVKTRTERVPPPGALSWMTRPAFRPRWTVAFL